MGSDGNPLTGGATGKGIDKNILDCYRFLVHNYDDGDAVYLFGFSRGAYTVRSLAGLIGNCGILRREHAGKAAKAYSFYRRAPGIPTPFSGTLGTPSGIGRGRGGYFRVLLWILTAASLADEHG